MTFNVDDRYKCNGIFQPLAIFKIRRLSLSA